MNVRKTGNWAMDAAAALTKKASKRGALPTTAAYGRAGVPARPEGRARSTDAPSRRGPRLPCSCPPGRARGTPVFHGGSGSPWRRRWIAPGQAPAPGARGPRREPPRQMLLPRRGSAARHPGSPPRRARFPGSEPMSTPHFAARAVRTGETRRAAGLAGSGAGSALRGDAGAAGSREPAPAGGPHFPVPPHVRDGFPSGDTGSFRGNAPFQDPCHCRLHFAYALVGFHLEKGLAQCHGIPFGLQPSDQGHPAFDRSQVRHAERNRHRTPQRADVLGGFMAPTYSAVLCLEHLLGGQCMPILCGP